MKLIANILHQTILPLIISDNNGNQIYCEYKHGYWFKYEYDDLGRETFYEDSWGDIRDNRP